jgi:hypothetical protein
LNDWIQLNVRLNPRPKTAKSAARGHSQIMWCCFCQFFTPLYPLVTVCDTASSTPHHKICDYEPTTPPPPTPLPPNILTKHICNNRFKTLFINWHYFNALLNLGLNGFPLRFSLVCWINGSAVFHAISGGTAIYFDRKHWFVI